MVKNNKGGNKSKRVGRKFVNAPTDKSIRYKDEEGEMYAVFSRLLGGDHCEVVCEDGQRRLCIIRKKFRGSGKRENKLVPGIWCLVGVRDWEVRTEGKQQKCDLLSVYNDFETDKIRRAIPQHITKLFLKVGGNGDNALDENEDNDIGVDFVMDDDDGMALSSVQSILNQRTTQHQQEQESRSHDAVLKQQLRELDLSSL
jgi:translation initiation factor 1A